jgi:hypothetical protein
MQQGVSPYCTDLRWSEGRQRCNALRLLHPTILLRFELIGGEVVPMCPKGARQELVKIALNRFFQRAAPGHLEIAPETTLRLDKDIFVEPEFCIFPAGST